MEKVNKAKYLGDLIMDNGKMKETLADRKRKAMGMISEVNTILEEIPLGKRHVETGLILRQTMFLNALLLNSEAWNHLTQTEVNSLESLDHILLSNILTGRQKTSNAFLHLESGTIPIRYLLA